MIQRLSALLLFAAFLAGCPTDNRRRGAQDAAGIDAGPRVDAGPGLDAGPTLDSGAGTSTCGDGEVTGAEVCDGTPECAMDCLSATYSGELTTTDLTWARNTAACGAGVSGSMHHYDSQPFTWQGTGSASLTFTAVWSGFDGYLHAFDGALDPASPTTGCLAGNDDEGGTSGSAVTVDAMGGEVVGVVLSTFSASSTGGWTLTVTR